MIVILHDAREITFLDVLESSVLIFLSTISSPHRYPSLKDDIVSTWQLENTDSCQLALDILIGSGPQED